MAKIERVLISVSDKERIVEFAKGLVELNVEIISTGGTAKLLRENNIPITLVSDYTGFPEMLDGRVKTLHPKIHAGLLARRDSESHMRQLSEHGIAPIDMVVVNLYPFEEAISKKDVKLEEVIENIDIGGPAMLRSAAKNYQSVAVIVNTSRYREILKEMRRRKGEVSLETRKSLALEVFYHTAGYDSAIFSYLSGVFKEVKKMPESMAIALRKSESLRYGENPHQKACFYVDTFTEGSIKQLHGKELSFNNFLDLDSAFSISNDFDQPCAAIIKHTNPCGVASSENLAEAYSQSLACDPVSAFGSIVGLNREVDAETAERISAAPFVEAVIAPAISDEALEILRKKKDLRVVVTEKLNRGVKLDFKKINWGMLVQDRDLQKVDASSCRVVSRRKPSEDEFNSLLFAWGVVKHVKSNAIVLSVETRTVGIGAGQMSRVDAVELACKKAGKNAIGSVLASDAFFPFRDAIDVASKAGVKAVIQPGGSLRDQEVTEAVNKHKMAMVFTGMRHFKH